jgi:hypothetical protein
MKTLSLVVIRNKLLFLLSDSFFFFAFTSLLIMLRFLELIHIHIPSFPYKTFSSLYILAAGFGSLNEHEKMGYFISTSGSLLAVGAAVNTVGY